MQQYEGLHCGQLASESVVCVVATLSNAFCKYKEILQVLSVRQSDCGIQLSVGSKKHVSRLA